MANAPKYMYMISQRYPFGKGEVYLEREIKAFSEHYDKVFLFPLSDGGEKETRELPANVELKTDLTNWENVVDKKYLFKNFFLIMGVLLTEYMHTSAKGYFFKKMKEFAGQTARVLKMKAHFEATYLTDATTTKNAAFYSVWMDEGALLFALLKKQSRIPSFVFRLHGYDLFDDRRDGNYMPFQGIDFKYAKRIFMVSQAGHDYLSAKGKYVDKLQVNYSGIYDNGENPLPTENVFSIVSCSHLVDLKRVDQIAQALKLVEFPVKWIHFGDGPERSNVEKAVVELPESVQVTLKGAVHFKEILETYKTTPFNMFLHLSRHEGLPMAVVESQSFGIPAIATDAGGTREIVNETTGHLIPVEITVKEVAQWITDFKKSTKSTAQYRAQVKEHWRNKFNATENYTRFVELIEE